MIFNINQLRVLETHNKAYKMSEETKIIDRLIVEKFLGLGRDEGQLHTFTPLVEGSFNYSLCKREFYNIFY